MIRKLLAACALLVLLAGHSTPPALGLQTTTAAPPSSVEAPTPPPPGPPPVLEVRRDPPRVSVTAPGDEPRATLRHRFEVGASIRRRLRIEVSFSEFADGTQRTVERPIPLVVDLDGKVAALKDGLVTVALEVTRSDVDAVRLAYPDEIAVLRDAGRSLVGRPFEIDLDDRGVVAALRYPDPMTLPEPGRTWVPRLARVLEGVWIPLPADPVGVHGAWTIEGVARLDRLALVGKATCTLVAIEEGRPTLKLEGKFEGLGQAIAVVPTEGPLEGVRDLTLVNGVFRTGGRFSFDPTDPLPSEGRMEWMAQLVYTGFRNGSRIDYRPLTLTRVRFDADPPRTTSTPTPGARPEMIIPKKPGG